MSTRFSFFYGFGGAFPPGLNHDGAQHGLFALRILNGESLGIYTPEAFGHETGFYHVMAAVFRVFGASKETIELTATIFGALSVGLFYGIIKRKTGHSWLALALSLLWISSSALILYSRVGWQLITLVPAAIWVAASCRFYFDDAARAFLGHSNRPQRGRDALHLQRRARDFAFRATFLDFSTSANPIRAKSPF